MADSKLAKKEDAKAIFKMKATTLPAGYTEAPEVFLCCRCSQNQPFNIMFLKKAATDLLNGDVEQWMCKPCNALASRMTRLLGHAGPFLVDGYKELKAEERAVFYKDAAKLAGPELKKNLTETITSSTKKKQTSNFINAGDFEDYDVVEERMRKKDPIAWENMKENAPQTTHPHTKKKMIWVMTMKLSNDHEESRSEGKKREIQSDKGIGASKKVKTDKQKTPEVDAETEVVVRLVEVTEAQLKRLTRNVPKAEDVKLKVEPDYLPGLACPLVVPNHLPGLACPLDKHTNTNTKDQQPQPHKHERSTTTATRPIIKSEFISMHL